MAGRNEGVKTWEKDIQNAARSVVFKLQNFTSSRLVNAKVELWHGTWRLFPPGIDAVVITFRIEDASPPCEIVFTWINPYIGEKSVKYEVRTGDKSGRWQTEQKYDNRNQMTVSWILNDKLKPTQAPVSSTPSIRQSGPNLPQNSVSLTKSVSETGSKALNDWKYEQNSVARSVTVTVFNQLPVTLNRGESEITAGSWSRFPPETIQPGEKVEFGIRAKTNLAGCKAMSFYQAEDAAIFKFQFESPLVGHGNFIGASSSPNFLVSASVNSDSHAFVTFTVFKKGDVNMPQRRTSEAIASANSLNESVRRQSTSLSSSTSSLATSSKSVTRVMGVPLEVLVRKDRSPNNVPTAVNAVIDSLLKSTTKDKMIFRSPGNFAESVQIRNVFENPGSEVDLSRFSVRSLAYFLKSFFYEQPEPLIPRDRTSFFVSFIMEDMGEHMSAIDFYRSFMLALPVENVATLKKLCELLNFLHNSSEYEFPASISSVVFGPLICREDLSNNEATNNDLTIYACQSLEVLIEHCLLIFP